MEEEDFYIIIQNRYYRHNYGDNDFHIEKIFSRGTSGQDEIIITNDSKLLSKYLVVINEDELKKLCKLDTFVSKNIRINSEYFSKYDKNVYEYFTKIKDNKIISANMDFRRETVYPYDHDPNAGVDRESYRGWIENRQFNYFQTPERYKKNGNDSEIFEIENVSIGNLTIIKNLFNVNLLEIGNNSSKPDFNWELRNNKLRYFDKTSSKRLYINKETLEYIQQNNDSVFTVETKLDCNHYIEYHITGIELSYDDEIYEQNKDIIFDSPLIVNDVVFNFNVVNNPYYNNFGDISEENQDFWDEF
jgi:hypothetical protein